MTSSPHSARGCDRTSMAKRTAWSATAAARTAMAAKDARLPVSAPAASPYSRVRSKRIIRWPRGWPQSPR